MITDIASRYTVCGCDDVLGELAKKDYAAVISIEHPGAKEGAGRAPRLAGLGIGTPQHIFTFCDNFVEKSPDLCEQKHVIEMLEIMRQHRGKPILVHCRQGKARSAAVALLGIADELGYKREDEAAEALNQIRDVATPNPLIVNLTDTLLCRNGALKKAVRTHQQIAPRMEKYVKAVRNSMAKHAAADPERAGGAAIAPERLDAHLRRLLGGALKL